tara:strand:- start:727 stop:1467 length:741 start_codon:yes stop_codon:yes gene_type:complete
MKFQSPLEPALLIKRYKRFLADVRTINNDLMTVHCANTGSLMGLSAPGQKVWIENSNNPSRKLQFSWKLNELSPDKFVVVDTGLANKIVKEALNENSIVELSNYSSFFSEVPYGTNSRIDFLLEFNDKPKCYLEVKSVTLSRRKKIAEFPDSVTSRGAKHLIELEKMVKSGFRAVMLFLICRNDCEVFDISDDLDPFYAKCFSKASEAGVEVLCYDTVINKEIIKIGRRIPLCDALINRMSFNDAG